MNTDELWGGVVESVEVDLRRQRVRLVVRLGGVGASVHDLVLTGVKDLRFFNAIPGPWDYAELTEVEVVRSAPGETTLRFMLWSEDAGMVVRCAEALLDGSAVA